jgi:hypothetical protein
MQRLGLNVADFRGRDADDPDYEDDAKLAKADRRKMCLDTPAVGAAIAIGADIEFEACGSGMSGGPACVFHGVGPLMHYELDVSSGVSDAEVFPIAA